VCERVRVCVRVCVHVRMCVCVYVCVSPSRRSVWHEVFGPWYSCSLEVCCTFFDGYCSTVQGLLDWFEVDLGITELSFIQIDLCVR